MANTTTKGEKTMLTLICLILTQIGALNWLLIGIFNWNLVGSVFAGWWPMGARIIYVLVGLAMFWLLYVMLFRRDIISYNRDFSRKNVM